MSESVLDRYIKARPNHDSAPDESEEVDDLGAFGWLRGIRDRAIMLELRLRDGSIEAFGLAWLEQVKFNPSEGVLLRFGGKNVHILGRHLNSEIRPNVRLFSGIVRHRVPWIQEVDEPGLMDVRNGMTVIEQIRID